MYEKINRPFTSYAGEIALDFETKEEFINYLEGAFSIIKTKLVQEYDEYRKKTIE